MMRRGRPPHPDVLTPRQWEVLELVREGLSNDEIGRELGISKDGAKFHVSEILTKLGLTSRREAAEWEGERAATEPAPTACLVELSRLEHRQTTVSSTRGRALCVMTGGRAWMEKAA